jgi:hypothetical protein
MTEQLPPVRPSAVAFSPHLIGFAKLAFFGLLLAVGLSMLRHSLGDLLSKADPALSIVIDPTQSEARVTVSERTMVDEPSKVDEAIAGARQALRDNPLSPAALTLLARTSEQRGDKDLATRLMSLASRVDQRDPTPQLWLLNEDLRGGRVDSTMSRIDVLLRGQSPQAIEHIAPMLAPILLREPYRLGYVKLLRTNPPWRPAWFLDLLRRADDLSALTYLFAELQASEPGPTDGELRFFLTRLTEAGMFDEAHDVWFRSLPPGDEPDPLYNAKFQGPLRNLPFDWVIAPVSHALVHFETDNAEKILSVDFLGGRVKFEHVSHLLSLAPGTYRFEGRERSQNLRNERGLRWRIACIGDTAETLATTDLVNGDTPWRAFGADFVVPTTQCSYQRLVLELPAQAALETEIVGRVSYAGLELRQK